MNGSKLVREPLISATPRTILVTGGRGFIGSHFVELCIERKHHIIDVDCLTYAAHRSLPFDGHPQYELIVSDIAELRELPGRPQIVVNFAAESHVDRSIADSGRFVRSNVHGVAHLLDLVTATYGPSPEYPLFIQISTDEVLGDRVPEGGFREDAPFRPSNPYAATKCGAEALVRAYGRTYGIPYLITRCTNNYGIRQHSEKLIPCAIERLIAGLPVPVHGDGSHRRNWIHVRDHCEAIYEIIDSGSEGEVFQIGSNEEYSVREVVTKIAACFGKRYDEVVELTADRPGVDTLYSLNCEKLHDLGWRQQRRLEQSLPDIIECHQRAMSVRRPRVAEGALPIGETPCLGLPH